MRGPTWNEKTVQRYEAEGRGKGHGVDYKPWLTVMDLSSQGESRRVPGLKTGRAHHLFSNVEWDLFLLVEWAQDVADIREQYPLSRDLTLAIAAELGIRHPCYPGTNVPTVMTVDMLVTRIHNGERVFEAFNAKRTEEAEDQTSLEKLEIQRYYFETSGIPHRLVLHSEIPQPEARNIELIRGGSLGPDEHEPYSGFYDHHKRLMASLLERQQTKSISLTEFCDYFDRAHGVQPGTGLRVAKMLMLDRVLVADLSNPDLVTAPLPSFHVVGRKGAFKVVGSC